ncbi:MAG: cytochrome c oxidase subunit 3 [Candidatus Competibacterales bacterium]
MSQGSYYVPHSSHWPIVGSVGLFIATVGFSMYLNGSSGPLLGLLGVAVVVFMLCGWWRDVIREGSAGLYSEQVDRSFRWGMGWFIFSEVMFFAAFFGALYYARVFSLPWLGDAETAKGVTQLYLWPTFETHWPSNGPGGLGGHFEAMGPWGLPFVNTLILLSSGATVTWAHWGLLENRRQQFNLGLLATVALGGVFVILEAEEYIHAYHELNLTLESGIYGSTFYLLTGFHGLHVMLGAIFLAVVLVRSLMGHFSAHSHFTFEAAAWYWHFVDVVWLGLFIFVYLF